jgi:TRIAD3 protein (E3 ubiquitin-protein ligase RNF216)
LFCRGCLKRFVEETFFGKGKTVLTCMNSIEKCPGIYTEDMLRRSLSDKVFQKYDEAVRKEAIKVAYETSGEGGAGGGEAGAGGGGAGGGALLFSCPHCETTAELPASNKVFTCPNTECGRQTCRLCKEDSHIPLRCEEVERKSETSARLSMEDAMTEAKIRKCPKCGLCFLKSEGCNKMTCKCGTLTCYICREEIDKKTGYAHFCQAFNCQHDTPACSKCPLYSNPEEDDALAVKEAGIHAHAKVVSQNTDLSGSTTLGDTLNKLVGGGEGGKAGGGGKRARVAGQPRRAHVPRPPQPPAGFYHGGGGGVGGGAGGGGGFGGFGQAYQIPQAQLDAVLNNIQRVFGGGGNR